MFPDVSGNTSGYDDKARATIVDKAEARRTVRIAIKGEMGRRGWNTSDLVDASGLDRSTLSDFLAGTRWPQSRSLGAIERALEWPVGAIAEMLEGGPPPATAAEVPEVDDLRERIATAKGIDAKGRELLLAIYDREVELQRADLERDEKRTG